MELMVLPFVILIWILALVWTIFMGIILPVTTYSALKKIADDISVIRRHLEDKHGGAQAAHQTV